MILWLDISTNKEIMIETHIIYKWTGEGLTSTTFWKTVDNEVRSI